jgi:hypothetical protein
MTSCSVEKVYRHCGGVQCLCFQLFNSGDSTVSETLVKFCRITRQLLLIYYIQGGMNTSDIQLLGPVKNDSSWQKQYIFPASMSHQLQY